MTENYKEYLGNYFFMGVVFEVRLFGDQLVSSVVGIPEGFEIIMVPVGGDNFKMQGGPIDGSTISFNRDSGGIVTTIKAGAFEFVKITPQALDDLQIVERLFAPVLELTPEKQEKFESLLESSIEKADGDWIEYDLPYPKHEFVQYITAQDKVIFHGSNSTDIEIFEPVRKSVELMDETGRGNIQAVYGTHDGLWAMFFAVVDRERLEGSIQNGVMYFHSHAGERLAVYNFSVNQDQLAERPYTEGALYLLPRDTFVRLKMAEESYANEWASEKPAKPYAKLRMQPNDFPFLEQISGHDDSDLLRLEAIGKEIRNTAIAASLDSGRFEVTLPEESPIVGQLDDYVSLQQVIMPAANFKIEKDAGCIKLVVTSLPPAMEQTLSESYKGMLE